MGKKLHLLTQNQLLDAIKTKDAEVLKYVYTNNYPKVEALILKNSGSIDYAKDIYQEAFITVWTHIKTGKFIPKNDTALQGYLYRVSKNKWTDVLRSKAFRSRESFDNEHLNLVKEEEAYDDTLQNSKLNATMDAFKTLGEPCKQLLKTFYFEKKSLKEVASEFKIEENTARNKKYRCMQKLREMVLASN